MSLISVVSGVSACLLVLVLGGTIFFVYNQDSDPPESSVVLIVGGERTYREVDVSKTVELFDPLGTCLLTLPNIPVPTVPYLYHGGLRYSTKDDSYGRSQSTAHYLKATGEILVCGGGGSYPRRTCDVLVNNTFQHHSNFTSPERRKHSGTILDNKLWIIGGHDGFSCSTMETLSIPENTWTAQGYDMTTDSWEKLLANPLTLKEPFESGCAVSTPSNNIILIGGYSKGGGLVENITQFNPLEKEWKILSPMLGGGRSGHGCVHINSGGNGQILVAGGVDGNEILNTAHMFDIDANQWKQVESMNVKRARGEMMMVNGRILFMGGIESHSRNGNIELDSIEEYNPMENTWTLLIQTMNTQRHNFAATAVPRSLVGC